MAIGISEDHRDLAAVVRRFAADRCPPEVARAALEAAEEQLPAFWGGLAEAGWLGLHLPEAHGGGGAGLAELAVVVEELGRAAAPGPFVPTVLAGAVLAAAAPSPVRDQALGALAAGTAPGAVALDGTLDARAEGDGWILDGTVDVVVGAPLAGVLVLAATTGDGERWFVVDAGAVTVEARPSLDPVRRVGRVRVDGVVLPTDAALVGIDRAAVRARAAVVLGAEAAGVGQWCVESSAAYAREREQFGRPIGQFQAVKHRSAEMLARTELARAAVWDAARALDGHGDAAELAVAAASALSADAVVATAKDCVQTFGGIGFTWEHDAHRYLRRATTLRALLGAAAGWKRAAATEALAGAARSLDVELPPEAEGYREEARAFVAELDGLDRDERRHRLADAGYVTPAWPKPWGRDAGPVEQLVIQEEFRRAKVRPPHLQVGAWALPTIIVYGTPDQQERWIPPTLRGEVTWCQLFSEPGAGSDLAALSTRAERVDGGWHLTGQKVWTSMAAQADWGICLARSEPDAPKHDGITCFVVDMRAAGIDIRPLRELTGLAMFNEVFLDEVFVPDDCVVGEVHHGWSAARTTLANERVAMGGGNTIKGLAGVIDLVRARGLYDDPDTLATLGDLVVTGHGLAVLGNRMTLRAVGGADPSGSEASVRKLLGTRHDQLVGEVGLGLLGPDGLADDGDGAGWIHQYLFNQCLTIAGGTSDIQRNVIAERLLDLPRDP